MKLEGNLNYDIYIIKIIFYLWNDIIFVSFYTKFFQGKHIKHLDKLYSYIAINFGTSILDYFKVLQFALWYLFPVLVRYTISLSIVFEKLEADFS